MKILVINAGSSSLKFQLFDMSNEKVLAKGIAERIGDPKASITYKTSDYKTTINVEQKDHSVSLKLILDLLTDKTHGVIKSVNEISGFGHRIVHGGPKHFDACLVDNTVIKDLKDAIDLAPLHTKAHLMGIDACKKVAKNILNVVVFDTGFHGKMPDYAYRYAVPTQDYTKLGVRRYGFHGTSHYYVSNECAKYLKKPINKLKIVVAHLGNGSSMSAVMGGHSVDTSMGFTPLEGLIMGTRSGDIDPAVVAYLCKKRNMTADECLDYLNKKCGLLAVSEVSSDMRELEANRDKEKVKLALDMLGYRIKKYIGAYAAAMGGIDALVFTAGIGENTPCVRELATQGLDFIGLSIDKRKNNACVRKDGITDITGAKSKVKVLVIPTNEELVIARETLKLIK